MRSSRLSGCLLLSILTSLGCVEPSPSNGDAARTTDGTAEGAVDARTDAAAEDAVPRLLPGERRVVWEAPGEFPEVVFVTDAPDGDLLLATTVRGALNLRGTDVTGADGGTLIARVALDGTLRWARDIGNLQAMQLAAVRDGSFYLVASAGRMGPNGPLMVGTDNRATFLTRFASDGTPAWTRQFVASTGRVSPSALSITQDGGALLSGTGSFGVTFDGATFEGSSWGFALSVDLQGARRWHRFVPRDTSTIELPAIRERTDGTVDIGINAGMSITVGSLTATNPGPSGGYLLSMDPMGAPVSLRPFDASRAVQPVAMFNAGDGGYLAVARTYSGTQSTLSLMRRRADGTLRWEVPTSVLAYAMHPTPDGGAVIVGLISGAVQLADRMYAEGTSGRFVARLGGDGAVLWFDTVPDARSLHIAVREREIYGFGTRAGAGTAAIRYLRWTL